MVGDLRMWLYRVHPATHDKCVGADHSPPTTGHRSRRATAPSCLRGTLVPLISDRSVEQAEPLGEVGLQLRLQLHLPRVGALLLLARRDERPERAGLEAVDPVGRVLRVSEAE